MKAQPSVSTGGVGMLGFCGGGITSLIFSTVSHDVSAVVALYAAPFTTYVSAADPRPDLITFVDHFKIPIQYHYGTRDSYIRIDDVARFRAALQAHNVEAEVFSYEGAENGFCNIHTDPQLFQPEAAALVRDRMLEFFATHLTVPSSSAPAGRLGRSEAL